MNPDRHIYLTTVVLAAIFATAINVLSPRDPFAGSIVHRDAAEVSRTAQESPPAAFPVTARALAQRVGISL